MGIAWPYTWLLHAILLPPTLPNWACRYTYHAWQDTEHGRQKFTRDGVETTIEKLGKDGVTRLHPL